MTGALSRLSLAQQLLVLQAVVLTAVVAILAAAGLVDERGDSEEAARQRVLDVAQTFARSPTTAAALQASDPARQLQPLAESVRRATGVDFVVVMSRDRIRYSHPNPDRIGGRFVGHVVPALRGQAFTERFTGTLGPSVRAVVPVPGDGRPVRGLVAVGITERHVAGELLRQLPALALVLALALGLAALGSLLVSRRLRRLTHGLGPVEITRMYEHHDAVLHAVREGLLVVDPARTVVLANDEAARLLGLGSPALRGVEGRPVADLGIPGTLGELLASGRVASDEIHLVWDAVLVVNQSPALRDGRDLGTVTTLRDHTELQALTGELNSVRGFAESLRAQAHEAANRLHTVVTMIELGRSDDAVQFATAELEAAQRLTDRLLSAVDEPVLAALLLGKVAEAHERGVELVITDDTAVRGVALDPRDLVTVVGNLVDNAVDAALATPPPRRVVVTVRESDGVLLVRVADTGAGLDGACLEEAFTRGWSTKTADRPHGRGLGLALVRQVITRYGGSVQVDNAGGAVFTVRLPVPAVRDRAAASAAVGRGG